MYEKTLVHNAAIDWEKKYNELEDKFNKLALQIIVGKLKPSGWGCPDNLKIDFSIIIYPNNMTYDNFIQTCVVPQLKKELKKLNICDK